MIKCMLRNIKCSTEVVSFLIIGVVLKSTFCSFSQEAKNLSPLATDAASELDILWHDGHTLCVDGTKVGILEESYQVGFAGLLEGHHGGTLEPKVGLEVLSNLTDQSLERELPQQKFCRFLVSTDLTKSDGSWPISVRLLDTPGGRSTLTGSFGSQLLSGSLSSGRFTCGLLCSSHSLDL